MRYVNKWACRRKLYILNINKVYIGQNHYMTTKTVQQAGIRIVADKEEAEIVGWVSHAVSDK